MDRNRERILRLAEEIASGKSIEIDDIELLGQGKKKVLRVIIDREGGIGLDDCESFSKDFSALLDVEDPIEGRYVLEVSSPGLDRPLKRMKDYIKYTGKLVKVVLKNKVDGNSILVGRIAGVQGETISFIVDGKKIDVSFSDITRARLELEI